jgi:hypothetical protein
MNKRQKGDKIMKKIIAISLAAVHTHTHTIVLNNTKINRYKKKIVI